MKTRTELKLSSPAFREGELIPTQYTCDGDNISPILSWSEANSRTRSFALIVEDPDASRGVFTHWLIYNIPASAHSLSEAVPTREKTDNGSLQGRNDATKIGYTGPCPPPGPVHHYNFILYALDSTLNLKPSATREQLLQAMKGHILGQAKMTGIYKREPSSE